MVTRDELTDWVIDALEANSGQSTIVQVCKHIWSNHEGELRSSGDLFYTWQYDVRWAATRLRKQGKMRGKDTSPRGIWDLA